MSLTAEIYQNDHIRIESGLKDIVTEVCSECARAYSEALCAGVYLTDDAEIREKNLKFRKIDSATDVLSFPLLDSKNGKLVYTESDFDKDCGCIMLGDIVISMDRLFEQADDYGHSNEREMAFLVCHGMLHLLGYDHINSADEQKMLKLQEDILVSLGYIR